MKNTKRHIRRHESPDAGGRNAMNDEQRVEQNICECTDENGRFDWDEYQHLCDIADYWDMDA